MFLKKRLLGIGLIVAVALIIVAVTSGVDISAKHAWSKYHWERSSNPVVLTLGRNFSDPVWTSHFNVAVDDWNESSVLALTGVEGTTSPGECAADTGTIEVCSDDYGDNGWLGIAQIWIHKTHILQGHRPDERFPPRLGELQH